MDLQLAFNSQLSAFDLAMNGADLSSDAGLTTAIIVSLYCDRRADADDLRPDNSADRRGWWGDSYAALSGDALGSKLWLLGRDKQLPEVARRAEEYAREALAWLISDGIARRITVSAQWHDAGLLSLSGAIERPDGSPFTFKFANLWEALHV